MIKALVSGSGGRMGGRIIAALADQKNIAVAGAFEKRGRGRSPGSGQTAS
jgi:dihydrodipicolinate reductase